MSTIVALADSHLFHEELSLPNGDILVHAGDLTQQGTLGELEIACDFLRRQPHPYKIVVAGNHDRCFETSPGESLKITEGLIYLQDSGVVINGLRFWGSPWQPEFHQWAFNLPRGTALANKWATIPDGIDVLITHCPPLGYGDRVSPNQHVGCADLLARVLAIRPRIHLFGHIHNDRGVWTDHGITWANVTTDEGFLPATVLQLRS